MSMKISSNFIVLDLAIAIVDICRLARLVSFCTMLTSATLVYAAGEPIVDGAELEGVVVTSGKQESDSASEGRVTAKQLKSRPLLRPAEVLEAVPGMIVTQHSGDGKANQYFLRGFNLDHGSDFSTKVNGMPVNNVSHAHGQGYMDLNFLIPELINNMDYRKGAYAAEDGDFATTGSSRINYVGSLEAPFLDFSLGEHGYKRFLTAGSQEVANFKLLGALELVGNDGPWDQSENLVKSNVVVRISSGTKNDGYSLTGMAYEADWTATEQVAARAVESGEIGRYGTLAATDGGKTHRYSVSGDFAKTDDAGSWKANAYLVDYALNLFSTPSGLLDGQHEQADERVTWGGQLVRSNYLNWGGSNTNLDVGLQLRQDNIPNLGLYLTTNRGRDSVVREDKLTERSFGLYSNVNTQWNNWARTNIGLRLDMFKARVASKSGDFNMNNGGDVSDNQISPKLGLVLGPFGKTEYFANWGQGFHSNDARGATAKFNVNDGTPAEDIPLIAKATGGEIGVRTEFLPNWYSSLTLWQVALDSELVYVGDEGITEPKGSSRRYGLEWSNFYSHDGVILDADIALSHARFDKSGDTGRHIPNAIPVTASLAVTHDKGGKLFGGIRTRYLGAYPLEETGTVKSKAFWATNLKLGYRYDENVQLSIDLLNIFNSKANDIEYFGASCTGSEGAACGGGDGVEGRLLHPLEPRSVRLGIRINL